MARRFNRAQLRSQLNQIQRKINNQINAANREFKRQCDTAVREQERQQRLLEQKLKNQFRNF